MSATLMALIALATMLVSGNPSRAASPGPGGGPDPDCVGITATLTATPSSIDRETSTNLATVLAWSVNVPKRCPFPPTVTLERRTVPLSGHMTAPVNRTTIFVLRADNRDLARATVNVQGDPGFIGILPGKQATPYEIAKFNQQWMQPVSKQAALAFAGYTLSTLDSSGATGTGQWMAAMVRMFDLTQDTRYLDQLHDLIQLTLKFRDDRPLDSGPNVFRPIDQIRNKVGLPAWGGGLADNYGLHSVDEITSTLYAYPIAAFARIVAGNPSLQTRHGSDAIDYANRVLKTVGFFLPQIHQQRVGNFIEAMLVHPEEYRNRPTEADCQNAWQHAMNHDPNRKTRWDDARRDCNNKRKLAGKPMPHNINLTFSMVLIELSRVLDTPFYLQSPRRAANAESMRDFFFVLIPRQVRYFTDHLNPQGLRDKYPDSCNQNVCWYYMDHGAEDVGYHPEDTDHGSMDMSFAGLFTRDAARLNAAAKRLNEPFRFLDLQRFARTFVENIAAGHDFKHDTAGRDGEPSDNTLCEGWLELSRADAKVWQVCHDMSLRIIDEQQPYLNIGNHSMLLMSKQLLTQ